MHIRGVSFLSCIVCILFVVNCLFAKVEGTRNAIQCLSTYASSLTNMDESYVSAVKTQLRAMKYGQLTRLRTRRRMVVDIGLGSILDSQVYRHMLQLNISSIDHSGKLSSKCKILESSSNPSLLKSVLTSAGDDHTPVFVHHKHLKSLFGFLSWIDMLDCYPDTIVLMNDLSDEEWYANRLISVCQDTNRSGRSPVHCYLPLLPMSSFNFNDQKASQLRKMLLSRLTLDQVKAALSSYRQLIECLVPEGQLFRFNLRHISSADYWTGLTHLLGLNYSTTANAGGGSRSSSTVSYLDHLIAGGLKAELKPRQVCVPSADTKNREVCHGKSGIHEVSPSVCEDTLLPAATAKRLTQCATRYAETIDSILSGGGRYRTLLLDQMLYSSPNTLRRAPLDSSRLIMNVAPGTTGTTSLFLTMSMLNITGRHFAQYRVNCTSTTLRGALIDWDMKILSLPQYGASSISGDSVSGADGVNDNRGSVFWADTPVSERWWQVFRMYPHSKIMMTDVRDDAVWIKKRHRDHCTKFKNDSFAWDCTVPFPASLASNDRYDEATVREFYNAVHVSRVQPDLGVRMFAAYRSLIRCAVPPEQQMWIYFTEQNDSAVFWNSLISFTNISVRSEVREALIEAGIPKESGKSGCTVGGQRCYFKDGVIAPSVCSGIVSDRVF